MGITGIPYGIVNRWYPAFGKLRSALQLRGLYIPATNLQNAVIMRCSNKEEVARLIERTRVYHKIPPGEVYGEKKFDRFAEEGDDANRT